MLARPVSVPDSPGSYQFKDADGRIIYIGKARSLRSRLASYFVDPAQLHPRTAQMVAEAASVEWIQVRSDVEAIMLEFNLIKEHRPRFNVRLVDDKSYPYLVVTAGERYPRAYVTRAPRRPGMRYFGPYAHAYAIRETLDILLRSFPIRTCSDAKFVRHQRLGRPCLLFHIERCSGPCVGEVTDEQYGEYLEGLCDVLDGDTQRVLADLRREMDEAAGRLEYEHAARLRDQVESVELASERQEMVADANDDLDVVAIADSDLEAAAQILHVRRGRVVGRQGLLVEKVEALSDADLVAKVLELHYGATPLGLPKTVLTPILPTDAEVLAEFLSSTKGARVTIAVPQRGRKKALLDVAHRNATEQLARHRLRRASDLSSRARALEALQGYLSLERAPLRIECYDMSHLQGSDYVGSMVVLEDGLAKRSDYRRFKVQSVPGNDDYAAMEEVLRRRLRHLNEAMSDHQSTRTESNGSESYGTDHDRTASNGAVARDASSGGVDESETPRRRPTRFAYRPQLIVLDGGKGQLHVGERVLAELGLTGEIELCALAKRFEEVYVPGGEEPIVIPRDSEAIYLLQQVRDEAHRFAISYHRTLRAKRVQSGVLDEVSGLGPARRKRLIAHFGSLRALRAASLDELGALTWLPNPVATDVYARLHPEYRPAPPPPPIERPARAEHTMTTHGPA